MANAKDISIAIKQICEEKGIPFESVIESIRRGITKLADRLIKLKTEVPAGTCAEVQVRQEVRFFGLDRDFLKLQGVLSSLDRGVVLERNLYGFVERNVPDILGLCLESSEGEEACDAERKRDGLPYDGGPDSGQEEAGSHCLDGLLLGEGHTGAGGLPVARLCEFSLDDSPGFRIPDSGRSGVEARYGPFKGVSACTGSPFLGCASR